MICIFYIIEKHKLTNRPEFCWAGFLAGKSRPLVRRGSGGMWWSGAYLWGGSRLENELVSRRGRSPVDVGRRCCWLRPPMSSFTGGKNASSAASLSSSNLCDAGVQSRVLVFYSWPLFADLFSFVRLTSFQGKSVPGCRELVKQERNWLENVKK